MQDIVKSAEVAGFPVIIGPPSLPDFIAIR